MAGTTGTVAAAAGGWGKPAALLLALAAIGVPVNSTSGYAFVVVAAVVIFSGDVSARAGAWLGAAAIVAVAMVGQSLLSPSHIEEGHNIFLPDAPVLQQGLPADVYKQMAQEFEAR